MKMKDGVFIHYAVEVRNHTGKYVICKTHVQSIAEMVADHERPKHWEVLVHEHKADVDIWLGFPFEERHTGEAHTSETHQRGTPARQYDQTTNDSDQTQ